MTLLERPTNKMWGLQFSEQVVDGQLWWFPIIKNPFYENNGWTIGLNAKFLQTALQRGVSKFIIRVGEKEIIMLPPDKKELKRKDKMGEFENRPSIFADSPPLRIYKFSIVDNFLL